MLRRTFYFNVVSTDYFCFCFLASGDISRKKLLQLMSKNQLLPVCFSRIFMGSGLTFRSLIHFESILVYGVKKWSGFILLQVAVQFSQHHLLKRMSFSHWMFLPPLLKINWPCNCGFVSRLFILFYWSMCLFLCLYHTVLITTAL